MAEGIFHNESLDTGAVTENLVDTFEDLSYAGN